MGPINNMNFINNMRTNIYNYSPHMFDQIKLMNLNIRKFIEKN